VTSLTLASADIRALDVPVVLTAAPPKGGVPGLASPQLLASVGFTGKEGEVVRLARVAVEGDFAAPVLAVVGVDPSGPPESLRRAVGAAVRTLTTHDAVPRVGLALVSDPSQPRASADQGCLAAVAEGALLGAADAAELVLAVPGLPEDAAKPVRQLLARAEAVAGAVKLARRLTNEPPNRLYPETFADQAAAAVKGKGIRVKVFDEAELAKDGYGGIIAVGQGSVHAPRLVKLSYSPMRAKRHVALVGKGITFDSGGLSLKTRTGMATMKSDMAGAAAVLGAVRAASDIKLPVKVTAWLCLAENMPSGAASRPGDVVIMKDGHAVEVTNTDAEGRLVLADGIAAARADGADQIIDIATLTGAQITALGNRIAGVMGTEEVRDALIDAADQAGEGAWPMPLPAYLMDVFKSEVADFTNANLSDGAGGMLSAGLFLRQFTGGVPWAHIDCAGPAFNTGEPFGYTPKGGTGFGVRTLLKHLENLPN
jgi:leucyl aminopeptidase